MHKYQNFFENYLSYYFIDGLQENIKWASLNFIDQTEHLNKEIKHLIIK